MLISALRELLDANGVAYETVNHDPSYTAQETAKVAHISGYRIAKTVMAKLDGKLAMVVLPATNHVNLDQLRRQTGAHRVELAHEDEFKDEFPECELGAMPPFGNLYGMEVFVEKLLGENETIAFNAGGHDELMTLAYRDFERLARPRVIDSTD
jgi:Ala-tRNA(Pro) deacylase